jgi:hypothetical protein
MNADMQAIMAVPRINLLLGWVWLTLGFLSGLGLGLFFHREDWLGGYAGLRRRLYRLAHISFFGLGVVNLCFYVTVRALSASEQLLAVASGCFLAGALSMPVCCLLMAHFPRTRLLFAVPVSSLLLGGALTMVMLVHHQPTLFVPGS